MGRAVCGDLEKGRRALREKVGGNTAEQRQVDKIGEIRTRFRGNAWGKSEEIGSCYATGVLKIGSVYRQGSSYYLQVFLKECKYKKRDTNYTSWLSDDEREEDEGYDTVM